MPEPDITITLAERGNRYGEFSEHARIAQNIKSAMADSPNWNRLAPDQKEGLEMIAHKAARILNGNPDYHDSWHDIVGYTKLVANRVLQDQTDANQAQAAVPAVQPEDRGPSAARAAPSRSDAFLIGTAREDAAAHYGTAGEPLDLKFAIQEAVE